MSDNPGFGVLIHRLFGGRESYDTWQAVVGKRVTAASMREDGLRLSIDGVGGEIEVYDDGQSCCEHRYMTTDDDVTDLIGGVLVEIETRDMGDVRDEYGGCHEQMAVKVVTDKATITLVTHNEHNGYYGGFALALRPVSAKGAA